MSNSKCVATGHGIDAWGRFKWRPDRVTHAAGENVTAGPRIPHASPFTGSRAYPQLLRPDSLFSVLMQRLAADCQRMAPLQALESAEIAVGRHPLAPALDRHCRQIRIRH